MLASRGHGRVLSRILVLLLWANSALPREVTSPNRVIAARNGIKAEKPKKQKKKLLRGITPCLTGCFSGVVRAVVGSMTRIAVS